MESILESINKAALQFLAPLTIEEIYPTIVKEATHLVNAEFGSIFFEKNGEFQRVYASDPQLYNIKPRKRAFIYKAFTTQVAFVTTAKELQELNPELQKIGIQSVIYIPLAYKNKAIGVLTLYSQKKEPFTQKELEIVKLFGAMATLAIKKTQLQDETQKALETRDLFISMAAHEFRTPLTTIHGYVQLLRDKLKEKQIPEALWAEKLSWETYRLSQLINELLTINRIRTGQLQYTWKTCNLLDILERAITEFSFVYPERTIKLQSQIERNKNIIIGDFDKLLQTLTNILDNAAKFSPTNTPINITIKEKVPYILLQITDQGKGISKKDLPKIFQGYYKGTNHTQEGMGLGLFLAYHIITNHKGSIKIKTKATKGTTIEILLPKAKIQKA